MSKDLEALERLGKFRNEDGMFAFQSKDYFFIKKEFKELEECREMMKRFNEASVPSVIDDDTYKKAKALDVIKPYLNDLIGCNVYDEDFVEYFIVTKNGRKYISKEEYDSLKEELLCNTK